VLSLNAALETNLNKKREKSIALQEPQRFKISCLLNKIYTFGIE
jgi:hypothetical protein